SALPTRDRRFGDDAVADPPPLRIGVLADAPGGLATVAPECARAAEAMAALLESLGHRVSMASPDALADITALISFTTIQATAVAHDIAVLARAVGRAIVADDVEPLTWSLSERGRMIAAADLVTALEATRDWSRRVAPWWSAGGVEFDLLLTPTLAEPPPLLGDIDSLAPDPTHALERLVPFGVFTAPFNVTGQPAISLPAPIDGELPIGVQFVAAPGE